MSLPMHILFLSYPAQSNAHPPPHRGTSLGSMRGPGQPGGPLRCPAHIACTTTPHASQLYPLILPVARLGLNLNLDLDLDLGLSSWCFVWSKMVSVSSRGSWRGLSRGIFRADGTSRIIEHNPPTSHPRPTATPDCLRLMRKKALDHGHDPWPIPSTCHLAAHHPASSPVREESDNERRPAHHLETVPFSVDRGQPPTGLLFLSTPPCLATFAFSFPRHNHTLPSKLRSYPANRCQSESPLPPPIFLLLPPYIVYPNTFLLPTSVVRAKHRRHLSLPSRGASRCQVPYVKLFRLICAPIQPITPRPMLANTNSNSSCWVVTP
ncbi:hypothetical protein BKA56DRAFT_683685 [Ilyonectria sp. MPI-CAGE-AT-0026]|nr:hypothetical protein BKA56DRAFT_683685 [Ilyonectria sp. MPI-CAGE-AT-0026]